MTKRKAAAKKKAAGKKRASEEWRLLAEGEKLKPGDEALGSHYANLHPGEMLTSPHWKKLKAFGPIAPNGDAYYRRRVKKAPRKDASQVALSIVEQVTGGKLKS